jgi:hypothetical protein
MSRTFGLALKTAGFVPRIFYTLCLPGLWHNIYHILMKLTFAILLSLSSFCAPAQSKKETEDWLNYYLDKYFSAREEWVQRGADIIIERSGGNYLFDKNNMIRYVSSYTRNKTKNTEDSLTDRRLETINLTKVKKITYSSLKDSVNNTFLCSLTFDFFVDDFTVKPVKIYDDLHKKDETEGYRGNYTIYSDDQELMRDNLLPRMIKAFEHLIILNNGKPITEVF